MSDVPSNLIPTRITQLPSAPLPASADSLMQIVYQGNNYHVRVGDILTTLGPVPNTRNIIAGTGMAGGGPLSSDVTLGIAAGGVGYSELVNTGVAAGVYGAATTIPVFVVDVKGRITAASSVSVVVTGYVPNSRTVTAGTGLTGGGALGADITLAADLTSSTPLRGKDSGVVGISNAIARADHRHPSVDISDDAQIGSVLALGHGGTSKSITPVPGGIVWCGSDGLYVAPAGLSGQVLVSGGANVPSWGSILVVTDQPANVIYAGPASGPDAPTAFRAIVNADLPASGVLANTYGSGTQIPVVTVNAKGVVTNVTTSAVASVPNAVTFTSTGGAAPGATFDGSAAKTIDYSTVGAAPAGAYLTALTGDVTTVGSAASLIKWGSGNVVYVPLAGNIQTYINNATAGDTLILASGTYTITATLIIDKSIGISGQGSQTNIASSVASQNVFNIYANNVRLADMSLSNTASNSAAIQVGNMLSPFGNLTGVVVRNVTISASGAGIKYGIRIFGSNVNILNGLVTVASSDDVAYGIDVYNTSGTTQNCTVNILDVVTVATGATNSEAYHVNNVNNANTILVNMWNCTGTGAASAGSSDCGLEVTSTTTFNATANAYHCSFSGADFDVKQAGSNVVNLYSCNLINKLPSGTLVYKGLEVAETFNAITLAPQIVGFTVAGGTTPKTLTVPLDASVSGTNTGDQTLSGLNGVAAPAANTADYLPQWDGTDSKTLKNGLAVPAGGLAGLTALGTKQGTLVSGTNIKTINTNTLLGAGNLTLAIINWFGAYNGATLYLPNDGVSYAGSSYICTVATGGGVLPTDITKWNPLAMMGNPGVSGISGGFNLPITVADGTSILVTHNFNAYPVVQVYDESGAVIIPVSVTFTSANAVTVVLSAAIPGTTPGHIICSIGGVSTAVISVATDYTLLPTDNLILVTAACTITLPTTTGLQGKTYSIKDMAANGIPIIVSGGGVKTIDDELTKTLIAKYTTITVFTNGVDWFII